MPRRLELTCHACDFVLAAETEEELIDLASAHAQTIHHHVPPRDHILARIHLHNR